MDLADITEDPAAPDSVAIITRRCITDRLWAECITITWAECIITTWADGIAPIMAADAADVCFL